MVIVDDEEGGRGYCVNSRSSLDGDHRVGTSVNRLLLLFSNRTLPPVYINNLTANLSDVPLYSKFELTFDLTGLVTTFPVDGSGLFTDRDLNPFNPTYVDVEAVFTPPTGSTKTVAGFWYQAVTLTDTNGTITGETVVMGATHWKVRFTPQLTGTYHYYIKVSELGRETGRTATYTFTSSASANKGFIRIHPTNHHFFQFDTGAAFNPVGINLPPSYSVANYANVFADFVTNKVNRSRLSEGLGLFKLEWLSNGAGGQFNWWQGLGRYNLVAAYRADQVLALAETNGVALIYSWDVSMALKTGAGFDNLSWNPYTVTNGGVITTAAEYISSTDAKNYVKRHLRYLIARFGYSPAIMNWEAMDEMDDLVGSQDWQAYPALWGPVLTWHSEMLAYIKSLDVYGHLNSASTCQYHSTYLTMHDYEYVRELWALGWDIIDTNVYTTSIAPTLFCLFDTLVDDLNVTCNDPYGGGTKYMPPAYGLPLTIAEWATDAGTGNYTAANLQEALWVTTMNGGSIVPWYYAYANTAGFMPLFKALALFLVGEDPGTANLVRVRAPTCNPVALSCHAIANATRILGWVTNSGAPATGTVAFTGLTDGSYAIEIWNPVTGVISSTVYATATAGNLTVTLPTVTTTMAFKAYPGVSPFSRSIATML
jgi:hypothetical protein